MGCPGGTGPLGPTGRRCAVSVPRVVVSDPRRLHREAMARCLAVEHGLETASAGDPKATILQAQRLCAQVVLIAGANGSRAHVHAALRSLDVRPRTLVFDAPGDDESLLEAIEDGADGYLTRDSDLSEIVAAIHALCDGESVVPPSMLGPLLRRLIERRRAATRATQLLDRLTPREREVLGLLLDGLDDRRMAARLVISPQTARTHVQRILRKLDVHSRVEAISLVVNHGLESELELTVEGSTP